MPPSPRWALAPKFLVFLLFMTQFMLIIALGGGVVPTLHSNGYSLVLLIPAAILVVLAVHLVLSAIVKRLPVRCRQCKSRSRFHGFGWWPFIYKFDCADCGTQMRFEVSG